ncbi:hypothetical protein RIF29_17755 [Crotalaria pallida]|uniref:Uncharacterized protein n=1 Tax=Crotalaria pallida TaxID=3830 RepID=A0AAN9FHP4_CROPI
MCRVGAALCSLCGSFKVQNFIWFCFLFSFSASLWGIYWFPEHYFSSIVQNHWKVPFFLLINFILSLGEILGFFFNFHESKIKDWLGFSFCVSRSQ